MSKRSTASKGSTASRSRTSTSFRVGRVRAYLRGRVWYLCCYEDGRRHQPRVGPDRGVVRQMAAEINAQLEVGVPSALWFQPVSLPDLRQRWLDYHEHDLRSSVVTVRRYRQATEHLLGFVREVRRGAVEKCGTWVQVDSALGRMSTPTACVWWSCVTTCCPSGGAWIRRGGSSRRWLPGCESGA
jgi:hypothetical protein